MNRLKMHNQKNIKQLLRLKWSVRRIARETGHHRDTIKNMAGEQSKCTTNPPTGVVHFEKGTRPPGNSGAESAPGVVSALESVPGTRPPGPVSLAAPFREYIEEQLAAGVDAQNIHLRLIRNHGFTGGYDSVKRFVRRLRKRVPKLVGRMVCSPGEEGQVDYGRGAPVINPATGARKRPWLFRMTLGHSRHSYEEVVWQQTTESFIQCHVNAFREFGGVVKLIRCDNLKAGVISCSWHDYETNPLYQQFADHYGFAILPHRPGCPEHKGKTESGIGYTQRALEGLVFTSLQEQNEELRRWNRQVARQRIHGSTKRQVWQMFVSEEQPALQPLPAAEFELFRSAIRKVHRDGYIQVEQSYYAAPPALVGEEVEARWTAMMVRIYHRGALVRTHVRSSRRGGYVRDESAAPTLTQTEYREYLERRATALGPRVGAWVTTLFRNRGLEACRPVQGVLGLRKKHPPEVLDAACGTALTRGAISFKAIQRLCAGLRSSPALPTYTSDHEFLRPSADYQRELFPEGDDDEHGVGTAVEAAAVAGDAGLPGGAQPGGDGR